MKLRALIVAAAAMLVVATPALAQTSVPATTLQSTVWRWVHSVVNDDTFVAPVDRDRYTIAFATDGTFSARADCNQLNGTYRQFGRRLTLQPGPMTLAACGPDSKADDFVQQLGAVASQAGTDTALVLNLRLDSGSMVFEAQPTRVVSGTSWDVQSYNNGRGGVTTLVPDTSMTVHFAEDGTISGSSGCNAFAGSYTVDGDSITISQLATTKLICSNDVMEQEQAFLTALAASTQYALAADRMTTRNDDGAIQVDLVPPASQE
jgi:heat shock protein HslJ